MRVLCGIGDGLQSGRKIAESKEKDDGHKCLECLQSDLDTDWIVSGAVRTFVG